MRETFENICILQKRLNDLELENQVLKNLLDQAHISYAQEIKQVMAPEAAEPYDPDQGARIVHPNIITADMANEFYSWFWGRQDVYARRHVKKATGESGYYPQCNNFWTDVCSRKHGEKVKCRDSAYQSHKALTKEDILRHLQGRSPE